MAIRRALGYIQVASLRSACKERSDAPQRFCKAKRVLVQSARNQTQPNCFESTTNGNRKGSSR